MPFNPAHRVRPASLLSSDTPNTATTGSDSGLLVPPVDPAALISADTPNGLSVGSDGNLVATGGGGSTTISCTISRTIGALQAGDYATLVDCPAASISGWRIASKTTGSVQVDVRQSTWPGRPGAPDSMTGGNPIAISASDYSSGDTSLWANNVLTAGNRLEFYVLSAAGINDITIQLDLA